MVFSYEKNKLLTLPSLIYFPAIGYIEVMLKVCFQRGILFLCSYVFFRFFYEIELIHVKFMCKSYEIHAF